MRYFVSSLIALFALSPVSADDWPQFRGPGGRGVSTGEAPVRWGATENIRWKADLPGRGLSSPVIVGGRVYVTASDGAAGDRLHVLCFDAATGRRLWQRSFWGSCSATCHPKTCMAAPTPLADDAGVFALFATSDLFRLDKDGLLVWYRPLARDYPEFLNQIGAAASPVLIDDLLVVPVENSGSSFAVGIDAKTGKNRWKIDRPQQPSWVTPLVIERAGQTEFVLQSGDRLSGHAALTGKNLWTFKGEELSKIPTPAAGGGLIFIAGRESLLAVRPVANGADPELAWKSAKLKATTASPLFHKGSLYTLNSAGVLSAAEAATGKILWQERLTGPFSASPILAGGRLYIANEQGETAVVALEGDSRVLAVNDLKEPILATPAVADGAWILIIALLWEKKPGLSQGSFFGEGVPDVEFSEADVRFNHHAGSTPIHLNGGNDAFLQPTAPILLRHRSPCEINVSLHSRSGRSHRAPPKPRRPGR